MPTRACEQENVDYSLACLFDLQKKTCSTYIYVTAKQEAC